MKLKLVSVFILRVFSLFLFVVYVIGNLLNLLHFIFSSGGEILLENSVFTSGLIMNIITLFVYFVISVLFWVRAKQISELVLPAEDLNEEQVKIEDLKILLQYGIGLLGLYFFLSGIPELLSKIVLVVRLQSVQNELKKNHELIGLIAPAAKILIGFALIYRPFKISNIIKLKN